MVSRPFRFIAQVPDPVSDLAAWGASLVRIEDLGFSTVALADHFTGGYEWEPVVTLTAAASACGLRLQTAVLGNDYRHPVVVHRMAATLDLLSGGRVELGMGAGWMRSDYDAAGLTYDRPGLRIERLAESVAVIKGLFAGEPFTFKGQHFTVDGLTGVPATVQPPHPPLLIGGGGRRVLSFAAAEADIVGINANLAAGSSGRDSVLDVSWEGMATKIGWVRAGAEAAGRDPDSLELSMAQWLVRVTDDREEADALIRKMASRLEVEPEWLEAAPGVVVGSVSRCVDKLQELRDRLGISYIQLFAGPHSIDLAGVGPVVGALAGR